MLIAQNWVTGLLGHSNPGWSVTSEELDAGYVRVGFETEGYETIPETTGPLVIGRVETIEELTEFKKPIRHCHVNVGDANGTGELQSIVCGARNFAEGDLVVVCLPGAVLPGNFAISARETYGRTSAGMICSASELGLTEKQNSGIITLPADYGQPGDEVRQLIGLDDTVFDVNVTPDRGYALSARGLSRELASAFNLTFADPAQDTSVAGIELAAPAVEGTLIEVDLREETKAIRFGLRKVSGIDPKAESPYWLQRELMLSGQRPVNAATDVTNYVMLLLGQPMHAFDAAKIQGNLTVRNAAAGEKFETLDHVKRELGAEDVVICDESGIQSMAGVMGGTRSEISDETTEVYFEAAIWDPITVARTSRRHKLSSEASRRFERGVDPAIVEVSLDLAVTLLVEIAGGTIEAGRTLVGEVPAMPTITMATSHPSKLAGVEYSEDTVIARLREVGCTVDTDGQGTLSVTPPTWRNDISMPADLVEEVLRLEGLEAIPTILPTPVGGRGLTPVQKRRRAVGHALAYNGYAEILPTPFIANDTFDVWGLEADDPRRNVVKVQNPLESDRAILGSSLLPSMLDSLGRNVARGTRDVTLFGLQQVSFARGAKSPMPSVAQRPDAATVTELLETLPDQPLYVATVGTGLLDLEGPWGEGRAYTFADAIESARIVARAADVDLEVINTEELPWHPGRCAALLVDGQVVGHAGELHPKVLEALELPARTCAMELNISALPVRESLPAPVLSAFPALHQDIALVVEEEIPAEKVRKVVEEGAGPLLESVELFDIYRSEQLREGRKSLAFKLLFRAADRTLTDEEASEARLKAAELASEKFGAEMRA
ncbi:Phenylalanine--tRNA ligase beta subunit [Corynebacterium occultum]|uniref:Phenylalanine--tRNA ligase beta subunit n=1 Tax=Corynebacterium occultum TaxID=2675219 RepID=A0A6B8VSY6_9CORY|nr:phenylalanine--tRNA ligase subunit beta [Corynebacterium occultum]QGU07263.1 Phenylalanine--tRNA ligase beta subunit [Corynebacterium occultum]